MENNNDVTKVTIPPGSPQEEDVYKVDLSATPEDETTEDTPPADPNQVDLEDSIKEVESEEKQPEGEEEESEDPTLEEVNDEPKALEDTVSAKVDLTEGTPALPEGVDKLVKFMEETGGDINDYVRLNRDVSNIDDQEALREYYKSTKPHLSSDEIDFLMEDKFSYDEDLDDERDIKRKKLERKEQVANAKAYLDGQKSKYYEEIKAGSKLTESQQEAINFFNRYNEESEQTKNTNQKLKSIFDKKTAEVFSDEFKGFDFNVGDKTYRFNVKDSNQVKESQSDISNFVKKFLAEDSSMKDATGYHKGLFAAMNPDAVARHFYEQGKADALKADAARSKNIDTNPRGTHGEIDAGGLKVRVVGDDSNSFKLKIKSKK